MARQALSEIVFSSATQLAAAIANKHVSAVEVLEGHLRQIDTHNKALNAVVTMDVERARTRAKEADDSLARGTSWGPLHGVPFTLKDAFATAGMRTTVGFQPLAEYVPKDDSTVAARLKGAGAILVGKTNVAELLADFQTSNPLFGRTNNPWNLDRTPGGSSGGAAAALASGMTPFEVGTDLSNSIRLPGAYCGVFGLKPTERRVAMTGVVPDPRGTPRVLRVMSCMGPMARTVDDLSLLYRIIAGPDGFDTEVPPAPIEDTPDVALKDVKIALAPTFPGLPVASSIRDALTRLAGELRPLCRHIDEPALPAVNVQEDLSRAGNLIGMALGAFQPQSKSPAATLAAYLELLHQRDASIVLWERFFDSWDILLCPASMVTAFPHCPPGSPLDVDGRRETYWLVSAHGAVFNYTGHPAVVVPYGLDGNGLPIGIQVVGRRWGEARLLGIARALTQVTGEFRRPPS
jgi:amidase